MTLEVQTFLRQYGNDFQKACGALKTKYGIDAKWSVDCPGLVLFKYDQIESPMAVRIVQECRGLILDSVNDWEVVAFPFTKFFNHGEGHAAPIDWKTARVQEKLDGSLMTLYWFDNDWHVASSGNPDAAGKINDFNITFKDLFWDTWAAENYTVSNLDRGVTYMFELTSQFNRVVVPHMTPRLTLIGMRTIHTHQEIPVMLGGFAGFKTVREFPLGSFEDIVKSFDTFDGIRQEGYVVVDGNFNRVKVKHPAYVALHHVKDSLANSKKKLVEIIRTNESAEFLVYFPEFKDEFEDLKAKYDKLVEGMDEHYEIIFEEANGHKKVNRKHFAMLATATKIPSYFFSRLDGRVNTIKEYVAKMNIDDVLRHMGVK